LGVSGLSIDSDGALLAVSSPVFGTSPGQLLEPPALLRIGSDGARTTLYTWPADASRYPVGFLRCDGPRCYASGFAAASAVDASGARYIVANFDRSLTRIAADGSVNEPLTGLAGATGVAVGPDDAVYLTFAPELDTAATTPVVSKGPRVAKLTAGSATTLYEGPKDAAYAQTGFVADRYPLDAIFSLALDGEGNVYLQDSVLSTMTLLPRAQ
jgi:hypothetical protein